jgi:Protein of unknown function (DUF4233)
MSRPEGQAADRRDDLTVRPDALTDRRDDPAVRPDDPAGAGPAQPVDLTKPQPTDPTEPQPATLTAEEREAQRLHRANRATRGGLAALLCLEAFWVLLVPRGIANTPEGVSTTKTLLLVGLAVVLVGCAISLTRPWGIAFGSILQVVLAGTILLVPALAVVVVLFVLLWLYLLRTRRIWLGTPRGWRMLIT